MSHSNPEHTPGSINRADRTRRSSLATPPGAPALETVQDRTRTILRGFLLRGRWSPGEHLPPERALAEELGVSRVTLRGALAGLAREGLVRPRQGSGIEVLDPRRHGGPDMFAWLIDQEGADPERSLVLFREILHLRRVLALDVMVRAAERSHGEDVARLETLAALQAERLDDPDAYLAGDEEYQRLLIHLAGGEAMELLFNSLQHVLLHHRELTLAFMGPLRAHHRTYAMVHRLLRGAHPRRRLALAELALDRVEARGLLRVKRLLNKHGQHT
jgi:DNA-binding FadR family transcriptional regulator